MAHPATTTMVLRLAEVVALATLSLVLLFSTNLSSMAKAHLF
jgi:hypothetical protein